MKMKYEFTRGGNVQNLKSHCLLFNALIRRGLLLMLIYKYKFII